MDFPRPSALVEPSIWKLADDVMSLGFSLMSYASTRSTRFYSQLTCCETPQKVDRKFANRRSRHVCWRVGARRRSRVGQASPFSISLLLKQTEDRRNWVPGESITSSDNPPGCELLLSAQRRLANLDAFSERKDGMTWNCVPVPLCSRGTTGQAHARRSS
jgi:hypothetical protein